MFGLNPWELGLILLAIMLLFGAKRMPEIGRAMGRSLREFKGGIEGKSDEAKSEEKDTADKS
jgi:sec-independent protein translocase protein TatA